MFTSNLTALTLSYQSDIYHHLSIFVWLVTPPLMTSHCLLINQLSLSIHSLSLRAMFRLSHSTLRAVSWWPLGLGHACYTSHSHQWLACTLGDSCLYRLFWGKDSSRSCASRQGMYTLNRIAHSRLGYILWGNSKLICMTSLELERLWWRRASLGCWGKCGSESESTDPSSCCPW